MEIRPSNFCSNIQTCSTLDHKNVLASKIWRIGYWNMENRFLGSLRMYLKRNAYFGASKADHRRLRQTRRAWLDALKFPCLLSETFISIRKSCHTPFLKSSKLVLQNHLKHSLANHFWSARARSYWKYCTISSHRSKDHSPPSSSFHLELSLELF